MRFVELLKFFPTQAVISSQQLSLVDPHFNSENLFHRQKAGHLVQIKKGRYAFPGRIKQEHDVFVAGCSVVSPSYISLESALSYYGFIPEGVMTVTLVTTKKSQIVGSDIGTFSYQSLQERLFWGYQVHTTTTGSFLMALPEKALLDYLYLHPEMNTIQKFEEWRINSAEVEIRIQRDRFREFCSRFRKKALTKRATLFADRVHNA